MIDVARFLAGFVLVAMRIAIVHDVDNFGIGETQSGIRAMANTSLVIL